MILLHIALILLATKILGIAAQKNKMPEVLGALIAGLLIGPVCFQLVPYDNNIKLLADIGVILLMFLAGLETNLTEFKKAGFSAFIIAAAGVIAPFILGTLGAFLFFQNIWENIFIGLILTATSVSITVETLTEIGKLNSRVGINILGAAVIDDILGLVIISIYLAYRGESGNTSFIFTMIAIPAFCLTAIAAIVFLPNILNQFLKNVQPERTLLTLSLAAAMLAAFFAESIGIAAITGAYLCGLLLSQLVHKETLVKGVRTISSGFLSPIFFASVGIEANLDGFSFRTLLIALFLTLIAVLGKILGCGGAARMFKMSRSESLQVGVGMVSRGEVAIITANIGLHAGIITNQVFLPIIVVVILTTLISPVLLKLSFSHRYNQAIDQ